MLRSVQVGVGFADDVDGTERLLPLRAGGAQGDRDVERLAFELEAMAFDKRTNALPDRGRSLKRALRKDQGEFFAAVTGEQFFLADHGLDDSRQLAQRKVAAKVAVLLINRFEVIDVKKQQRQRSLVPRRPGQLPVEELHEVALVVDFGQGVDDG